MHKIKAVTPRLSDEDPDPLEQDDQEINTPVMTEGWNAWSPDDVLDVHRLIKEKMPVKMKVIFEAYLAGMTYKDINVTEKYWRWHFAKGLEFIKKELRI
jgi:hypothetical protein